MRKFEELQIRPSAEEAAAHVPVPITDYGLFEALTERWETQRWDFIGRYIGSVLLHLTRGTTAGLLEDGIPAIHTSLEETVRAYAADIQGRVPADSEEQT